MINQDTICAISTAQGNGAIAIIRMSGNQSLQICDSIFKSKNNKKIENAKRNTILFGEIIENDQIIDEVLVSVYRNPYSFTGEDSIEIACHGALYIQQRILNLLCKSGARLANPGEYTQRAYLNGKMDLSQAEAVADLIASNSAAAHKVALQQMRGGFSNKLIELRNKLLNFISLVELELDFGEEDVEFANRDQLKNLVNEIKTSISKLVDSFKLGNVIKNGVPVAIVGKTNAGKSTLLNAILNEEKAIVSDIEGTTRDVIEDTINLNGITFRFIDTAGIRDTADKIESMGIERTFNKINQANIVLLMIDANNNEVDYNDSIIKVKEAMEESQTLYIVFNKIDKAENLNEFINKLSALEAKDETIKISAKQNINIDKLIEKLIQTVNLSEVDENNIIVTNARHHQALNNALEAVLRVQNGITMEIPTDFLAQDIRETLHFLGEITGDISTDEVLGNIFKNFCIGK